MPKIHVVKPFTLSLSATESLEFRSGTQSVSEEVASHWFVQAHCEQSSGDEEPEYDPEMVNQVVQLQSQLIEQQEQIATLQQQLTAADALAETLSAENQAQKSELEARDTQIATLQQQLTDAAQGKKK